MADLHCSVTNPAAPRSDQRSTGRHFLFPNMRPAHRLAIAVVLACEAGDWRNDMLEACSGTTLLDNIAGTGGSVQVTDAGAAGQPKCFYRIVIP